MDADKVLTMACWNSPLIRRAVTVLIIYLAISALLTILDLATGGTMHSSVTASINWAGGFCCAAFLAPHLA